MINNMLQMQTQYQAPLQAQNAIQTQAPIQNVQSEQTQLQTPQMTAPLAQDTFTPSVPNQTFGITEQGPMPSTITQSPVPGGIPDASDMASSMLGYNINNYVFGDGTKAPVSSSPNQVNGGMNYNNGIMPNAPSRALKNQIAGGVALATLGIAAIKLLTKKKP